MKIREFIQKLQQFDPELEIFVQYDYFISEETGIGQNEAEPELIDLEIRVVISH